LIDFAGNSSLGSVWWTWGTKIEALV